VIGPSCTAWLVATCWSVKITRALPDPSSCRPAPSPSAVRVSARLAASTTGCITEKMVPVAGVVPTITLPSVEGEPGISALGRRRQAQVDGGGIDDRRHQRAAEHFRDLLQLHFQRDETGLGAVAKRCQRHQVLQADRLRQRQGAEDGQARAIRDRSAGIVGNGPADAPERAGHWLIERDLVLRRARALRQHGLVAISVGIDHGDVRGCDPDKAEAKLVAAPLPRTVVLLVEVLMVIDFLFQGAPLLMIVGAMDLVGG
jgi:hypothetical protein